MKKDERDGVTFQINPDNPLQGMWVPTGWCPSWELGYPIFEMNFVSKEAENKERVKWGMPLL